MKTSRELPSHAILEKCELRLDFAGWQVDLYEPLDLGSAYWALKILLTTSKILSTLVADRQMTAWVDHDVCWLVEAHDALVIEAVQVDC